MGSDPGSADAITANVEQLCNIAAVIATGAFGDVVEQLVGLSIAQCESPILPEEVSPLLAKLYGVDADASEVLEAVARLQAQGRIMTDGAGRMVLRGEDRARILEQCEKERALEERVREQWLAEVSESHPDIPTNQLWDALEDYMQTAFARHGVQTVLLLSPGYEVPPAYDASLSALLDGALDRHLATEDTVAAATVISKFFRDAGKSQDRIRYVDRLADAAVAFFLVHVSPTLSATLRSGLAPLTVFLDTNFVFAFLGLHADSIVQVSDRLVQAVAEFKLPIKMRYHEVTANELQQSLALHKRELKTRKWPQALSRAAVRTSAVTGVELRYHETNARTPTEVDDFFMPYEHFDVLLKDRGVDIYRPTGSPLESTASLEQDYARYLAERHARERTELQLQHDAVLLATARRLRSNAKTTLEAAALIVTCDFSLFGFDRAQARDSGDPLSVVLPDMLWQVIRPFVPTTDEYEKAFAETFAIAEFRTIESRSAKAASRMLGLLATFEGIAEETAVRMLSNDLLLKHLTRVPDDDEFAEAVETALVGLNADLLDENAALEERVDAQRAQMAAIEQEAISKTELAEAEAARRREAEEGLGRLSAEVEDVRNSASEVRAELMKVSESQEKASSRADVLERQRDTERNGRAEAEKKSKRKGIAAAAVATALGDGLLLVLWRGVGWPQYSGEALARCWPGDWPTRCRRVHVLRGLREGVAALVLGDSTPLCGAHALGAPLGSAIMPLLEPLEVSGRVRNTSAMAHAAASSAEPSPHRLSGVGVASVCVGLECSSQTPVPQYALHADGGSTIGEHLSRGGVPQHVGRHVADPAALAVQIHRTPNRTGSDACAGSRHEE